MRAGLAATEALTPKLVDRLLAELDQLCRLGESLLEAELPPIDPRVLASRGLLLEARAPSAGAPGCFPRGLPARFADPRDVLLWASCSQGVRPVGFMADAFIEPDLSGPPQLAWSTLVGVTGQSDQSWDRIPRGWKTLVTIRFLQGVPSSISRLPEATDWGTPGPGLLWCRSSDLRRVRASYLR